MQRTSKHTEKLLFVFICLMTMLLTACGSNAGFSDSTINPPAPTVVGTPKAGYGQQIYHTAIVGQKDIATFDPALTSDLYSTQAIYMVFDGLVRFDDNLNVQPELAQSWEQSSDGLEWIFHLRSNLTFSDGAPLTSRDVAYSIDRALQPATKSEVSLNYLGLIQDADKLNAGKVKTIIGDSILTPDANTVVLKTNKRAGYFLETLSYPTSYVVEKRLIDKYGAKFTDHLDEGGGSGPFKVSQYIHGQEIDFVPNPYYYNLKPLLQKVVSRFIPSTAQSYQMYQDGKLDSTGIPPDRLDEAKQRTNEYVQAPLLQIVYIATNFLAKPFDDLRIRQAFALAIQRDRIRYDVYKDTIIPTYHIIPQGMQGYSGSKLVGPFNVQDTNGNASVAQRLFQQGLREEGWSTVSQMPPIKFTYYSGDPATDKVITLLIQMWQSVLGVNVTPDPVDFNKELAEIQTTINNPSGLQMWYLAWISDYPDPQDWISINFDKGAAQNAMNYGQSNTADANQEQIVQSEMERADAELDPTTRIQLYQDAEQQLVNQVAWIPLFQSTRRALVKPYIQGLVFNPLRVTPPTDWANIYIAQH